MRAEVYRTEAGAIYQCDRENCFYLEFQGQPRRLPVCALLSLKQQVDRIDLAAMIADPRRADVEVLCTCRRGTLLVVTLREIIVLKELLSGALVMLELNSILHRRLRHSFV
ncbi:MAG: hypothetical protein WBA12_02015 [Catalinimonas sp.]